MSKTTIGTNTNTKQHSKNIMTLSSLFQNTTIIQKILSFLDIKEKFLLLNNSRALLNEYASEKIMKIYFTK